MSISRMSRGGERQLSYWLTRASRIRKIIVAGQVRPLIGNSQINSFQMLISNLRGLDFCFVSLPPTVCGGFEN